MVDNRATEQLRHPDLVMLGTLRQRRQLSIILVLVIATLLNCLVWCQCSGFGSSGNLVKLVQTVLLSWLLLVIRTMWHSGSVVLIMVMAGNHADKQLGRPGFGNGWQPCGQAALLSWFWQWQVNLV
jgi:hypothetical protein